MTWNYRLIHMDLKYKDCEYYEMHEVFYDDDGKIMGTTQDPVALEGESKREVIDDIMKILSDLHHLPILKESELPGAGE